MEVTEQPPVGEPYPSRPRNREISRRLRKLLALYQKQLDEHPILTKAISRWRQVSLRFVSDIMSTISTCV